MSTTLPPGRRTRRAVARAAAARWHYTEGPVAALVLDCAFVVLVLLVARQALEWLGWG